MECIEKMKLGIIVAFNNNEKDIEVKSLIEKIKQAQNIEICLVDNGSKDNTFKLLEIIKDNSESNVSVINIKKFKSDISAIKFGAKHMVKCFNLNCLGYISIGCLNNRYHNLSELIDFVSTHRDKILKYHILTNETKRANQSFFESLFSVVNYLERMLREEPFC